MFDKENISDLEGLEDIDGFDEDEILDKLEGLEGLEVLEGLETLDVVGSDSTSEPSEPDFEDDEADEEDEEPDFDEDDADEEDEEPDFEDDEADEEDEEPVESYTDSEDDGMILYLIIDKPVPGLLGYFRESGLKVSKIFSDIKDAKNAVLMQTEPARIVVVDTGSGRFTMPSTRAELIDMLGISDEQNRITVFYTDSVLKIDTLRALGKAVRHIDWIVYKTTAIVAATIARYEETYEFESGYDDEHVESKEELLEFIGLPSKEKEQPRMNIAGFSSDAIITHMVENSEGGLEGFSVKI